VFHRIPGTDLPYAGSEGTAWGVAAIAGGLVFVAAAEWQARADRNARASDANDPTRGRTPA